MTSSSGSKDRPDIHRTRSGSYVWSYTSVKNILQDESYIGVLVNHQKEMRDGKTLSVPVEAQFRHEGIYPPLVARADWEQVQRLLRQNKRNLTGGANQPCHRYAGLLTCGDCGNVFVPMKRYWNGKCRVEYVCNGYHHSGKEVCTPHRIHEEHLDQEVQIFAAALLEQYRAAQKKLNAYQKIWALRKPVLDAHISALRERINALEGEIDEIVMQGLRP